MIETPIPAQTQPDIPSPGPAAGTLHQAALAVEEASALDPLVRALAAILPEALRAGPARDVLSGRRLGHALHPVLTDIPIGSWTSASVLDLLPGDHDAASQRLLAVGLLAALPTVATGASDWLQCDTRQRRVGIVHVAANSIATVLYASSLVARCSGQHRRGVALALAGGLLATAGGFLGGHLAATHGTAAA